MEDVSFRCGRQTEESVDLFDWSSGTAGRTHFSVAADAAWMRSVRMSAGEIYRWKHWSTAWSSQPLKHPIRMDSPMLNIDLNETMHLDLLNLADSVIRQLNKTQKLSQLVLLWPRWFAMCCNLLRRPSGLTCLTTSATIIFEVYQLCKADNNATSSILKRSRG